MPSLSNLGLYFQCCTLPRISHEFQLGGTFPQEIE